MYVNALLKSCVKNERDKRGNHKYFNRPVTHRSGTTAGKLEWDGKRAFIYINKILILVTAFNIFFF